MTEPSNVRQQLFDQALISPHEVRTASLDRLEQSLDPRERVDVMLTLGWTEYADGRLDRASAWIADAQTVALAVNDPSALIDTTRLEVAVLSAEDNLTVAEARLREVIEKLPGTNRSRLYSSLGQLQAAHANFDAAVASVDQGLADAQSHGDVTSEAALLTNRAVALMELGRFSEAEDDLATAEVLATQLGLASIKATAAHNLGVAKARRGDLGSALVLFDNSARFLASSGGAVALAHASLDQSEVLLEAGLLSEAGLKAARAEDLFDHFGAGQLRVSAQLQQALVAAAGGRWTDAVEYAARADENARAIEPSPISQRASQQLNELRVVAAVELRGVQAPTADQLTEISNRGDIRVGSLLDGALLLLRHGRRDAALQLVDRARGIPASSTPRRLDQLVATAVYQELVGSLHEAHRVALEGLELAQSFAVSLGISELRVMTERRVNQLAAVSSRCGMRRVELGWILDSLELSRSITLLAEPLASEDELAQLARLRILNRQILEQQEPDIALTTERASVERGLRRSRRVLAGTTQTPRSLATTASLPEGLFYFFDLDDQLLVLTRVGDVLETLQLGDSSEIRRRLGALQLTLAASASPTVSLPIGALVAGVQRQLQPVLERMAQLEESVVVPEPTLSTIPWSLFTNASVSHVPSLALLGRARPQPEERMTKSAVFAGPDLQSAATEAHSVAAVFEGAQLYVGPDAHAENALAEFAAADLVHFATHGTFRSDNPLHSSLRLATGPLTFYELLGARVPDRLVFSACDVGQSATSSALGVAPLLLSRGCRSLIVSTGRTGDAVAATLMKRMYEEIARGESLAGSLAIAQRQFVDEEPSVALFAAYGIG